MSIYTEKREWIMRTSLEMFLGYLGDHNNKTINQSSPLELAEECVDAADIIWSKAYEMTTSKDGSVK